MYFYGPVTPESVNNFNCSLSTLERGSSFPFAGDNEASFHANPVMLHINSPGGDADAIISVIRNMRDSKLKIYTIVDGVAFSQLFDKAFVLDAKQALEHGIIDGILDGSRRNKNNRSSLPSPKEVLTIQNAPSVGGSKKVVRRKL